MLRVTVKRKYDAFESQHVPYQRPSRAQPHYAHCVEEPSCESSAETLVRLEFQSREEMALAIEEEKNRKERLEWYLNEVLAEKESLMTWTQPARQTKDILLFSYNFFGLSNNFVCTDNEVCDIAEQKHTIVCDKCKKDMCYCSDFDSVRKRQRRLSMLSGIHGTRDNQDDCEEPFYFCTDNVASNSNEELPVGCEEDLLKAMFCMVECVEPLGHKQQQQQQKEQQSQGETQDMLAKQKEEEKKKEEERMRFAWNWEFGSSLPSGLHNKQQQHNICVS